MAVVGVFGSVLFSVSRNMVKTFDNLKWEGSMRYAQHDVHLQQSKLELTGINPDTLNFDMLVSAYLGTNPFGEINNLMNMMRGGMAARLVVGNRAYGGVWVIDKLSVTAKRYDAHGGLLAAKIAITLKAYA